MALPNTPQILVAIVAPNLPIAPNEYSMAHFELLTNVLRLYFNQVSSSINLLATPSAGVTASRPVVNLKLGLQYFDTTLGLPIWWNGTDWIDAAGTVV